MLVFELILRFKFKASEIGCRQIMDNKYRKNVAIFLRKANLFFVGERIKNPGEFQLPQGGVELGEPLFSAAKRELFEETNVKSVKYIGCTENSYRYEFVEEKREPKHTKYIGQEQTFFVFEFLGADTEIRLDTNDREFSSWKWVPIEEVLNGIVAFKRKSYESAINELTKRGIL